MYVFNEITPISQQLRSAGYGNREIAGSPYREVFELATGKLVRAMTHNQAVDFLRGLSAKTAKGEFC